MVTYVYYFNDGSFKCWVLGLVMDEVPLDGGILI